MAFRAVISLKKLGVSTAYTGLGLVSAHKKIQLVDVFTDPDSDNRVLADALTFSEIFVLIRWKLLYETLTLTDSSVIGFTKSAPDPIAVVDAFSKSSALSPIDSVTASDVLKYALNTGLTDPVAINDTHKLYTTRPISDTFTLNDSLYLTFNTAILEGFALPDSFKFSGTTVKTDPVGISDAINVVVNPHHFQTFSDTLTLTDSFKYLDSKPTTDPIGFTDAVSFSTVKSHPELLNLIDALAFTVNVVPPSDSLGMSDSITVNFQSGQSAVFNNTTFNTSALGA